MNNAMMSTWAAEEGTDAATPPSAPEQTQQATAVAWSDGQKKPRPYVEQVTEEEQNWAPIAIPQFVEVDGESIRSGNSHAVVRSGHERWPLGHSSDTYKPEGHMDGFRAVKEFAGEFLVAGPMYSAAHGYQVAREYGLRLISGTTVKTKRGDIEVSSRLILTHDHTAKGSSVAALVLFVGDQAIGSMVHRKMAHVGSQAMRFRGDIAGLAESAMIGQTAVLDLLSAAAAHPYTEVEKRWLASQGMRVKTPRKNKPKTLLEALLVWMKGTMRRITWNVWERRLEDRAIVAMIALLGPETHGVNVREGLGQLGLRCTNYAAIASAEEACDKIRLDIAQEEKEAARKAAMAKKVAP